jgi:hypothetical protein
MVASLLSVYCYSLLVVLFTWLPIPFLSRPKR